jgi:dTDP-4-dehydrorhamnose reductase
MLKILLLGADGQVGWELRRSLAVLGEVIALGSSPRKNQEGHCGDLGNLEELVATVREVAPHAIVNAAAYTAVDRAEAESDRARLINALAPGVLAVEAQKLNAWLVHYSTDYVFDGSGRRPWNEDDRCAPLSHYGRTKREGELAVVGCAKHLILRTSWVYGARGGNFAKTMLRLAAERESLTVVDDHIGAPTSAELLADVTGHALRTAIVRPELAGTYHCAAQGETSWRGYARYVLGEALDLGIALRAGPDQVNATTTALYPTPAKRPLNSRLDTQKLRSAFSLHLPLWQMGVQRMLQETIGTKAI